MAASLDVLSGGRLELGIGAGWMRSDYVAAGLPYDSAGERVTRLEESIAVLKGLFSGDPFTFTGTHFSISQLVGVPPWAILAYRDHAKASKEAIKTLFLRELIAAGVLINASHNLGFTYAT